MTLPFGPSRPVLKISHAERDREVARRLARIAARFEPGIFTEPEVRRSSASARAAPDTIRLLIAPDEAAFRRASGGRFPDWGLAVAFPASASIVMRPPRLVSGDVQDPGHVLVHELVHVYLALFLGPADSAAPRWFHEGLASLLAGEWGFSERLDLALALIGGRVIGLDRLERGFPTGAAGAALAYLESMTAVAHLRELSGEAGLRVLLRNLRQLHDFDAALRRTYGLTYGEFQDRWQSSLAGRYGWASAAASTWTTWTPAAILLVFLVLLRRAKYRSRLRELEKEERLRPEKEVPEWASPGSNGEWSESGGEWGDDEDAGPAWDPRRGAPPPV